MSLQYTTMVLDTSVIIKWFRQGEVLADNALALREAYISGQIAVFVPWLAAYELANVLRYKDELTTTQVQDAVQSLFDLDLDWISLSGTMLRRAAEIARVYDTTVYDAAFVASAEALPAIFVTADEQLSRRVTFSFVRFLGELEL